MSQALLKFRRKIDELPFQPSVVDNLEGVTGGSVWESNPPFGPRRIESPALKAGEVTGPPSPPRKNTITGEIFLHLQKCLPF